MERFEEKVIDLVDVVSGPDLEKVEKKPTSPDLAKKIEETVELKNVEMEDRFKQEMEQAFIDISGPEPEATTKNDDTELEIMVRKEIEKVIQSAIGDNLQKMIQEILVRKVEKAMAGEDIPQLIRECLTLEVEKAIAREIEILKSPK
jgi:hypothetical protein